jgi:hypothetical protein
MFDGHTGFLWEQILLTTSCFRQETYLKRMPKIHRVVGSNESAEIDRDKP